jgi:hypothetical protein
LELVVGNHAEYNRRTMGEQFRTSEQMVWDAAGIDLSEQALLWRGDSKLVCLPLAPDPALVRLLRRTLDYRSVKVCWPGKYSPCLSASLAKEAMVEQMAENLQPESEGFCWGVTPQFRKLQKALAQKAITLAAPELPRPESDRLQLELDSKSGFRQLLVGGIKGGKVLPVTPCKETPSLEEAVGLLDRYGGGSVIKCSGGAGGFNVRVFAGDKLTRPRESILKELDLRARFDGFWRTPPYLVEKYIFCSSTGETKFPTADWLIDDEGGLSLMGLGVMTITGGSRYAGVTMGRGALDSPLADRCERVSRDVAALLSSVGYRGWFDVDMAVGDGGSVWITEINTRRTGPAHAIDVAARLWGEGWAQMGAVCTDEHLILEGAQVSGIEALVPAFDEFNSAHAGEGLVGLPTFATHSLKKSPPYLGVLVAAGEAQSATGGLIELRARIRKAVGLKVDLKGALKGGLKSAQR